MKKEDILNNYVESIKQLGKELIDNAEAIVYDKIMKGRLAKSFRILYNLRSVQLI